MVSTGIDGNNRRGISGLAFTSTPTTPVAGYYAWWDATQIVGVADGASLTTWSDSGPNAHTLTSSGTAPLYFKTTPAKLIGGKPAVWFTAAGQLATTGTAFGTAQPLTWFAVGLSSNPATTQILVSDTLGQVQILYVSSHFEAFGGTALAGGTTDSSAHAIGMIFNGASSSVQVDGTTVASGNAGANSQSAQMDLGGDSLVGALGEVVLYASALSPGNMATMHTYLKNKWGTP